MSEIGDNILSSLATNIGGGIATGAIGGPVGMAIGGMIGVAKSVAPEIARWLGANDATVAATSAAITAVTGETDPDAAMASLTGDPASRASLRIQLADIASQQQAEENRAFEARQAADLADVADARKREVDLAQAGKRNIRADVMLGITVVGIVALLGVSIIGKLDGNSAIFGLIAGVIGVLVKCYADAFQYEFGSSRGSSDKSTTIAGLARNSVPLKLLPSPAKIEPQ